MRVLKEEEGSSVAGNPLLNNSNHSTFSCSSVTTASARILSRTNLCTEFLSTRAQNKHILRSTPKKTLRAVVDGFTLAVRHLVFCRSLIAELLHSKTPTKCS